MKTNQKPNQTHQENPTVPPQGKTNKNNLKWFGAKDTKYKLVMDIIIAGLKSVYILNRIVTFLYRHTTRKEMIGVRKRLKQFSLRKSLTR